MVTQKPRKKKKLLVEKLAGSNKKGPKYNKAHFPTYIVVVIDRPQQQQQRNGTEQLKKAQILRTFLTTEQERICNLYIWFVQDRVPQARITRDVVIL